MSLYTLTVDLLLKTGSFEKDSGKAARTFDQRMAAMQSSARKAGTAIGLAISAGIGLGASAVVGWTKDVARLSVEYDRLASLSGTSSEFFQRWAAGASTVGISSEKLADILKDTQDKIGDFVQTGGGAMADFFENIAPRVGVTAEQFRKLSGPDALGLYFKSLERANLSQTEMTFYMEAIASDSALLAPLLRNNAEGFNRWGAAADSAGAIIGGDMVESTKKLRDMTVQADLALMGIKNSVAEQVLPTFGELSEALSSDQTRQSFATFSGWIAGITAELMGALVQMGNFVTRAQELRALDSGGAKANASYDALNEQLGRVNQRRRDMEGWTSNSFGIPFTDAQKKSRDRQLADLRAEQAALQREITKRIAGDLPFQDAAPKAWLDTLKGNAGYKPTGNIDRAAREKGAKDAAADLKRQTDAQAGFSREAQIAAGLLSGPLDEAMAKHLQRVDELNRELSAGNILQADHGVLLAESALGYTKVAAEAERAAQGPKELLKSMEQEVQLLGMSGQARELYRRQMQAEADMRDVIARAQEAGVTFTQAEIDALLEQARAYAGLSISMEEAQRAAEDWQRVAMSAAGGVADTFSGLFDGSIRDSEDFFDSLKDVFKRGLADIARTAIQQKWLDPLQKQLEQVLSGRGFSASGTNFGKFGVQSGGGTAGANGTSFFDLFKMAENYGGGLTGPTTGGAGGVSTAAAGASGMGAMGGAMAGVAAFAPYAALIMAGMQMADSAYKSGFGLEHQNKGDMLIRANLASGGLATPMMLDSMLTDYTLRALGISGKTAAVISGSSLLGKAFGRSAPKITGQGITGTYGFGGLDGQSYADVKQKGGWFRSDKKWTQYGAIDPTVDRTFDQAANQIKRATTGLADQLGVDLSQKLAGVKVSLGKIQLSADSEEAQRQLEAYLAQMQDTLWTEAVKAAGFGGQLDGYFEAVDVFGALSTSIELAAGNAADLGRALNTLEIQRVNEAADYFQELADVAGTDLATQISRVTGLLTDYSSLMADVSTQLMTGDLSAYQSQALTIERTYRQQVKAANDYAKALGLSGARAEDLAKIEALRATNMGKLQAQIDADKKSFLGQLSISDLSPLTDQQKLDESMKQLQEAVAGGNTSAAQAAAQAALGFGKDLYASGRDYNALYGQVTGMIGGMKLGDLDLEDGTSMGELADAIEALPDSFSRDIFEAAAGLSKERAQTNAVLQEQNKLLQQQNQYLQQIVQATQSAASTAKRDQLTALNQR